MRDYATTAWMHGWLRHPVLGDPSFDTFERVGETVHKSEPPYEWAVNGSIFRDFDGTWYYYAGLYHFGYAGGDPSRFVIYRSRDRGETWEDLGFGFERGFCFEGWNNPSDGCPDVVLCWDERHGKYLLTYDTSVGGVSWENAHDLGGCQADSGAALAWADSPAGPFSRLPDFFVSNQRHRHMLGRWGRLYASTVLPREHDYIAFVLTDSNDSFAWGLACMTAPSPEGPWSPPRMLLSCERPEYYPCPMEFHPVHFIDGVAYAPCTSVAMNRNYQCVFTAPVERAHDASAWKLAADGNVWHAHDHPDEYHGIWGQTLHGFVEPDTGRYVVMFASKDERDFGTLAVAARPWGTPHSDGFTLTAHRGASVAPLLAAYGDFTLDCGFSHKGTVDFAFGYAGVLGPNDSRSDSVAAPESLAGYDALRVNGTRFALVTVAADGTETECVSGERPEAIASIRVERRGGTVKAWANGEPCGVMPTDGRVAPLALVLRPFSRIDCSCFAVEGEAERYALAYNAADAMLGAGQKHAPEEPVAADADLSRDRWFRLAMAGAYRYDAFVGEGLVAAKWNFLGDAAALVCPRAQGFGLIGVWVDGIFAGSLELDGEGEAEYRVSGLAWGRHSLRAAPLRGRVAVARAVAEGLAE